MHFRNITAFATLVLGSISAHAQPLSAAQGGDSGTNASPLTKPARPPGTPLPAAGTPDGYLFNLRPLGEDIGRDLADKGIYLNGRTLQQAIDLASGGLKRGTFYEGYNVLGVDLDMNRIAGIQGGSLHFAIDELAGARPQNYSGSFSVWNRAWGYNAAVRLNEFSYEQSLFDKRLDVRVGRLPVGTEFDFSSVYCEFIWGLCATPSAFGSGKGYPVYNASSTALVAKLDLTHHFYFNAGAYEDEPILANRSHYGWPGEDWDPNKFRGVTIPMQVGYKTTFKDEPYPVSVDVGGLVDTGDYSDPVANGNGLNRLIYGGAARVNHGKTSVWLQAEKTIFRPDFDTQRSLVAFFGANFQTSGDITVTNAFFGGLSYRGPFAARPNDSLNVLAHTISLSDSYQTYRNTSLALQSIHQTLAGSETYVEFNYGIALAPGVTLKPNLAYIWNPDQANLTRPVTTDKHAMYIGVAFSALLNETLGLPRFSGL